MEKKETKYSLLGNLKVWVCASVFVAMSIVLGKFVPLINLDFLRFSLENLPILMSGIAFGPVVGATVGLMADLIGCILVGYQINPLVMLGAVTVGGVSGIVSHFFVKKFSPLQLALSVAAAHIIGSVIIKSVGLAAFYDMPLYLLMLIRLLNYTILGVAEFFLIYVLLKNKGISSQIARLRSGR